MSKGFTHSLSGSLWPLNGQALCAEARRRTGLRDFGDPPIEPALSALVASLEHEANLHSLGRFLIRMHLQELLETRLRLAKAWNENPEVLDSSPLRHPVFITGMPRSGSTFLHELLAQDPAHRVPRVWEVMFPISNGNQNGSWFDHRVWRADASLWWFRRLAPQADSVHPIRALTPHECVAIHSYTLLSEEFVSLCRVPGYENFLHSSDLCPVYAWQKRFLQYLQQNNPEKRWVLKSPDHAYGLEALFSAFPDALIIQTHRNPMEVLLSLSRLTAVLREVFAAREDGNRLVEREARALAAAMERFIHFRDLHPELADRFIDVDYCELAADPLKVLRRIYRHFGISWSETIATRMAQLAGQRSRYSKARRPVFKHSDALFDVSAQISRFSHYCHRFGIPCEPLVITK